MGSTEGERRTKRSERAGEALSLQLARVRDAARLDALVLASDEGLPIAHAGEEELCTELAALAPFVEKPEPETGPLRVWSSRLWGREIYLVSYAEGRAPELEEWLEHTWRGISRILTV